MHEYHYGHATNYTFLNQSFLCLWLIVGCGKLKCTVKFDCAVQSAVRMTLPSCKYPLSMLPAVQYANVFLIVELPKNKSIACHIS